jgi:hypothetical protein
MQGAQGRLLPASVPFGFFLTAAVFHVGGWGVLLIDIQALPGFFGALGAPLAALHLITLGVLAMTAFGAAFQLLPVATRRPIGAVWPIRLSWFLLLLGTPTLGYGMAAHDPAPLTLGGALAGVGLALGGALLAVNVAGKVGLPIITAFVRFAMVALFAVLALGLVLVADFTNFSLTPFVHGHLALVHVVVGGFGFMSMLAMGFSYVLVPMFGLSPSPDTRVARGAFWLGASAVVVVSGSLLANSLWAMNIGAAAGLIGAGLYLQGMAQAMRKRMRRRLGISFVLVRIGWVLLPISIVLGAVLQNGWLGPNGAALFGFVLFYGWLLTFLLGVLQRIMPFLASMHAAKAGSRPPLVSDMSARPAPMVHAVCHLVAITLVTAGIALDHPLVSACGASIGVIGALAFLGFTLQVIRRFTQLQRAGDASGSAMENAYE